MTSNAIADAKAAKTPERSEMWTEIGGMLRLVIGRPEFVAFVALILLMIITAFFNENFLTWDNLANISRQISITGILAVGMTFVILTGGIDLSVGAVLALSSTLLAGMLSKMGMPFWPAALLAMMLGLGIGLINGFFVAYCMLPPIIVTLAMMEIPRGFGLMYSQGYPLPIDRAFGFIGRDYIWGIPVPTLIMLVMFVIAYVILNKLRIGRYLYAVGGNEEAAVLSGIRTRMVKMFAYGMCGLMASIGGIIQTSRLVSGQPESAVGIELDAIAIVVLGGTSIAGGRGHIVGTLIGAALLGVLSNGLNMIGLSPYPQRVVKGAILLIAVLIGVLRMRNRK